eukprot:296956_1
MKAVKRFRSLRQKPIVLQLNNPLSFCRNMNYSSIRQYQRRSLFSSRSVINPMIMSIKFNENTNHLYYGIYRRFAKKPSKKKSSSSSAPKPSTEPQGDPSADPNVVHTPQQESQLSTFVVIKEKTQETLSVVYIVGILLCCLPYTIYLVFRSMFSSSGADKIRNETFDLIQEDSRILRILGNDIIAKQVRQNVIFTDDAGQERLQLIYEIQGSKGNGRVDVEMLKEDKDWRMQYCIVSTQYSVIPIVDNRSLMDRPLM